MASLLHIDSSIQGDRSVSRKLSARAADVWRAAHPGASVVYRDLGADPVPHLDTASGTARMTPPDQHTSEQAASWALTEALVGEVRDASTIVFGMPLYNFGAPSAVKAWLDHLIAPGLSMDHATMQGLLAGREFIVLASRGGGYGPGTPKEGWDHASQWLGHGVSLTGLEPRYIAAELTLSWVDPRMEDLQPLATESLAAAEREIGALWIPAAVAA